MQSRADRGLAEVGNLPAPPDYPAGAGQIPAQPRLRALPPRIPPNPSVEQQLNLALRYMGASGGVPDYEKAFQCFLMIEHALPAAQCGLGIMYERGMGRAASYSDAVRWYTLAADRGDARAQFNLGTLLYHRQPQEAQILEQALFRFRQSAEQDDPNAQYMLGLSYLRGHGNKVDHRLAVGWFLVSANKDHAAAQYSLGTCYANGLGLPQDMQRALGWFDSAARQGHIQAQYELGLAFYKGEHVHIDRAYGLGLISKAAAQGLGDARNFLEALKEKEAS